MESILKKFAIRGLYGERDVEILFSDNIKIVVAENGYGKTTVLNALYALLSGNISNLRKLDFEVVEITFSDGAIFAINKSWFKLSSDQLTKHGIYQHLVGTLGDVVALELFEAALTSSKKQLLESNVLKAAGARSAIPLEHLVNMIVGTLSSVDGAITVGDIQGPLKAIREKFPYNIIYLPTYRRVEQDFKELHINGDIESFGEHSINFGMRDVDLRFQEITKEITSSSVEWFSKVNGQMLGQLIAGFNVSEDAKIRMNSPEAIKIVLNRIGNNIDNENKKEIIRLVESGEIFNGHDPLLYFISNLEKVYIQQKSNDDAIQDFSEVCNRYLVDKKIAYNESNVTIDIVRRKNGNPVDIEHLSSGEKQIISLFSRLYLKKEQNVAIFFDEPELSLSIEWQKTLLPDIINSGKCIFMFTTTHSPFIFDNFLAKNVADLGLYIKEL